MLEERRDPHAGDSERRGVLGAAVRDHRFDRVFRANLVMFQLPCTEQQTDSVELARGTWHPHFGVTIGNTLVSAVFTAASLVTHLTWTGSS